MAGKIPRAMWLLLPLAYFLFFFDISKVGLIGPDEPRYASISRAMAATGDWITPRLNGAGWFEKPALLYWMQGVAFRLGLSSEIAARLPVAILACLFLALFFWILFREFGCAPAVYSTMILCTSAGWIVCAQVGVTDLPLSATFSAALLFALPWVARRDDALLPAATFCLGLAVMAKGLVPLVLVIPLLYPWGRPLRGFWRDNLVWFKPRVMLAFLIAVLPWYGLCYARNGMPFLKDLIWKQHFQRMVSVEALQHGQPFWFYIPVILAAMLPWTPMALLALRRGLYKDPRRQLLLGCLLFGLLFFSTAVNKLPAYILPLVPAAAALMGMALAEARSAAPYLVIAALLLAVFPVAAPMLPAAVTAGLTHTPLPPFQWFWLLPVALAAGVWMLERMERRTIAALALATGAAIGTAYLKQAAAADLDRAASARGLWAQIAPRAGSICIDWMPRRLHYSLDYYSGEPLPECKQQARPLELLVLEGQPPVLKPGAGHAALQGFQ